MLKLGIMPGHGGKDRGTTINGFDEADYCLSFAKYLHAKVTLSFPEMSVVLLRSVDESVTLSEGACRAEAEECNLVYLLHVNSGPSNLHGGLLFHMQHDGAGAMAASAVHKAYPVQLRPMAKRPICVEEDAADWKSRARNVMLPYRDAMMSPVLIELFYASDRGDIVVGGADWTREQIASACLAGISEVHRDRG